MISPSLNISPAPTPADQVPADELQEQQQPQQEQHPLVEHQPQIEQQQLIEEEPPIEHQPQQSPKSQQIEEPQQQLQQQSPIQIEEPQQQLLTQPQEPLPLEQPLQPQQQSPTQQLPDFELSFQRFELPQHQIHFDDQEELPFEEEQSSALETKSQNKAESLSPEPAQPDSVTPSGSSTQIISQTKSQTEQVDPSLREPSPPLPFPLPQESLPSPSQEQPQSDPEAEAHEYVVEEILDKKLDANGEVKLLVKWENYPSSHNTWEPLDNLRDCDEVMQKYEIKRVQRLAKLYGGLNFYGEGSSKMSGDMADKKDKRHQEYKVSEVIGLTEVKDQKYFLVNLQDDGGSAYIRSSLANKLFPCKVIDFYMKHITWRKPT